MRVERVESLEALNDLLRETRFYANGKNIPVDHLYPTAAESRFDYENMLGIYLAKPRYAWMALWMAVLNRQVLRKRQIEYYRPDLASGDGLGKIGVYLPDPRSPLDERLLVDRAFLHLFGLVRLDLNEIIDVSMREPRDKIRVLEARGFSWGLHERREKKTRALRSERPHAQFIDVDEWQVAICQVARLVPDLQLVIERPVLQELLSRVVRIPQMPSEAYLQPSCKTP